uniref:Protein transport protein SEC23 n=2 Tax=Octactis speculum TaxID=3111310 RepID=A0A7S2F1C4_9STRA
MPRMAPIKVGSKPPVFGTSLLIQRVADNKLPPPMACRPYRVVDEGNCSPRFMRPTMHHMPATRDVANQTKVPLGILVQPMAEPEEGEEQISVVDFGENGPPRCTRCKGYVNCFVTWGKNGQEWSCNLCDMVNQTPPNYHCGLDGSGRRQDHAYRPELAKGSVDLVVTKQYCVRPVQQPIYLFVVDTSAHAMAVGFTQAILAAILAAADETVRVAKNGGAQDQRVPTGEPGGFPGGLAARVGIIGFDRTIQFYRASEDSGGGMEVSTNVVSDVEDPFAPLPPNDQWLFQSDTANPDRLRLGLGAVVDFILRSVPANATPEASVPVTCPMAALSAATSGLSLCGGRVFLFASGPPLLGVGRLRPRGHTKDYGTDREVSLYRPMLPTVGGKEDQASGAYYENFADQCAARQVAVDLFFLQNRPGGHANADFLGIATLSLIPKATGGGVHLIPCDFGPLATDTLRHLVGEIHTVLSVAAANETVLKVRTSQGLRCVSHHGPGVQRVPGELELATWSAPTSTLCIIKHDNALKPNERCYFQAALLYSSVCGRRMVRLHNICLLVTSTFHEVFRLMDLDATFTANLRLNMPKVYSDPLASIREHLTDICAEALSSYRHNCAKSSPLGQLILPESIKLMPLYTLSLLKSMALRSNARGNGQSIDPTGDERAAKKFMLEHLPVHLVHRLTYPRIYDLENMDPVACSPVPESEVHFAMPPELSCSSQHLKTNGAVLMDAGWTVFLYVGKDAPPALLAELFGVESINPEAPPQTLSDGGDLAAKVRCMLREIRHGLPFFVPMRTVVSQQRGPDELRMLSLMIEDKTKHDDSYVDYLCNVHRRIQNKHH